MARRYTLATKIQALNLLDQQDGDLLATSTALDIPTSTLSKWRKKENDLRHEYRQKRHRQFVRQKAELQIQMLERGRKVVACMDDETLEKAPLNQLATALGTLVNHALKLEEAIEDSDEQAEKVYRIEYLYDGSVHKTPPWARTSAESSGPIQDRGLRETLGENGIRQDYPIREGDPSREAWLVAGPDLPDVESGLAGFETDFEERDWYHD